MENLKESKIYNVSLISYAPTQFIESVLKSHISSLKAYSFCFHDRDIDKKPHTHILICSKYAMYLQTFINWFRYINDNGQIENTLGEKCIDIHSSFEYLIHENNPEKFQYSFEDRVTYREDVFYITEKVDKSILALQDILAGCSIREIALKYGRDFIFHYSHFRQLVLDIEQQEGITLLNINK